MSQPPKGKHGLCASVQRKLARVPRVPSSHNLLTFHHPLPPLAEVFPHGRVLDSFKIVQKWCPQTCACEHPGWPADIKIDTRSVENAKDDQSYAHV
jgi:hypothetical protein